MVVSPIEVLPQIGATAGGEAGVRRALEILASEVDRVMALIGCTRIEDLSVDYLELPTR